jgi:hypothetical protein
MIIQTIGLGKFIPIQTTTITKFKLYRISWYNSAKQATRRARRHLFHYPTLFKYFLFHSKGLLLFPFSLYKHKIITMSVHLLSSDNEEFKVDKDVAERSVLIKNMLEGK